MYTLKAGLRNHQHEENEEVKVTYVDAKDKSHKSSKKTKASVARLEMIQEKLKAAEELVRMQNETLVEKRLALQVMKSKV